MHTQFLEFSLGMLYLDVMPDEYVRVDDSLLESAAKCLGAASVRGPDPLQLAEAAQLRLESLAEKANEAQLTADEANEYDRFIELGDVIAPLRPKAKSQARGRSDGRRHASFARFRYDD